MKRLIVVLALALTTVVTHAQSVDRLATKLAEKGVITNTEAQELIAEAQKEKKNTEVKLPGWIQKMSINGDVRVRTQADHTDGDSTRIRERLRVRLGLETALTDSIKAGIGIATGSTGNGNDKNPTSTNHTFQAFNKSPLYLDYAYLSYNPADYFTLSAGKVKGKTALWNPTDLVWDTDINPDGGAVNLSKKINKIELFANAGFYVLNEQASSSSGMPAVYIAQPGVSYKNGGFSVKGAVAYEYFSLKGKVVGSNDNNYLNGNNPNASDYEILNPSLEIKQKNLLLGYTGSLFADYVENLNSKVYSGERSAYSYGLTFGDEKTAGFGTWNVKAMYRRLEPNATPTGLGDSDAYGGKSGKGVEVILTAGLLKNLDLGFDYYNMTDIKGKDRKQLYQLDFTYKF
ncbi:polyhydroxyalkanoate synthesis regulator phasin [Elusimicrobium posterum]|uniref:putative porin n=1 Tax=Elusimicrobium posterum TaxID=3116653 RepID=UPI003C74AC94